MAEATHASAVHGGMEIQEQKSTSHQFLALSLWGTLYTIMVVALLTVAFAMGLGWFSGLGAYALIGVGAALALKMSGSWWVSVIGTTVVLGLGGLVSLFFG